MSIPGARSAEILLSGVCLATALLGGGCQWSKPPVLTLPNASPAERHDSGSAADDRSALSSCNWVRSIASPETGQPPRYHWHSSILDDMLARPAARRPNFSLCLSDADAATAASAAIGLSRLGSSAGAQRLADTVRAPQRSQALRCAAAEALADIRQPAITVMLRELLDQYGQYAGSGAAAYNASVHAELIRGLAWHVDPGSDPRFLQALGSPSAQVRLEAVQVWCDARAEHLPTEVCDHRSDSDPRVRSAVLRLAAGHRESQALTWLLTALDDTDFQVRLTAIGGLGELGDPPAVARLEKLLSSDSELQRGAAVAALAAAGQKTQVFSVVGDRSPQVRGAVAEALARWSDRDAAATAGVLLQDASNDVLRRLFASLAVWPLPQAGPVLLSALDKPGYLARQMAAAQLAGRWPPAANFPVEASAQRRAEAAAALQERFRKQFGFAGADAVANTFAADRKRAAVSAESLQQLDPLLLPFDDPNALPSQRAAAAQALGALGTELIPALTHWTADRKRALPEEVYRSVLPQHDASFAELQDLASGELSQRRRAAEAILARSVRRPLSELAIARLNTLLLKEGDEQVWCHVLAAVAADPGDGAVQLAYLAIGHPAIEVRCRACAHLAAHPDGRHVKVLMPMLDDPDATVAAAAVAALSRQGKVAELAPLRRLLTSGNATLRTEAAVALARLGDPTGRDAVERMVYHGDPAVRRRAAELLGELGDRRNIAALITLLDDRPAVCKAALESLTKLAGRNVAQSEGDSPVSSSQQVRRWKEWFARQQESGARE